VLRAIEGDRASLEWTVVRFTPLLLAQADYRLGKNLRRHFDAADVVEDVWASTLPRLREISPARGHEAPTLLRYLSTSVLRRVQQLAERHLRQKPAPPDEGRRDLTGGSTAGGSFPDTTSTPISKAVRGETRREVRALIDSLDEIDRQVLVLRGIEQWSTEETGAALGITANAAAVRYHRALKHLREKIPGSVFHDLED
jgi:RNA polymerase sigma-70 factor, ECF subfamily